jgi:methyl-accepting chemotaxis protein
MKFGGNKIGTRLAVGFGALLLLLIAVAITAYYGMYSISSKTEAMLHGDAKIAENAARARANTLGLRRFEKDIFLNMGAKAKQEDYLKKWNEQKENLLSRLNDIEKAATLDQDRNLVNGIRKELAVYEAGMKKTYERILADEIKTPQEGNTEIDKYKAAVHYVENSSKDFAEEANKRLAAAESMLKVTFSRSAWLVGILSVVAMILGIGTALFVARGITCPLKKAISELTEGADHVAAASGQVSSSSQSLADGASVQAASIEETSSSLEEMSSMTKQNADNASLADSLMKESKAMVSRANTSMSELNQSMKDISKASDETSKIIKTIDEIAFQTNLLALNAAVEAARAGEAGAGFAVVANEVRNLAMRAADAAKNTSSLIEGTVKNIKEGSALVQRTNEAFSEVNKSAEKVAGLVSEIAAASEEQAQGIGQIGKAVAEMDKVTQQNAANAEESASASEEMSAQAEQMKKITLELASLVGGSEHNGSGEKYAAISGQPKAILQKAMSLKPFKGQRNAVSKVSTAKGIRPEDVIPLSDGDFKNF